MCGERRTEAKGKRREKSVKNAMLSPVHRGDICENLHAGRGERGITDQRGGGREGGNLSCRDCTSYTSGIFGDATTFSS